jgi:hypothetical protein
MHQQERMNTAEAKEGHGDKSHLAMPRGWGTPIDISQGWHFWLTMVAWGELGAYAHRS